MQAFMDLMSGATPDPYAAEESKPQVQTGAKVEGSSNSAPSGRFAGKVVIVTGAASGIGRAVALTLASQGCRLALTDRNSEGGRAVCEEIKKRSDVDVVFATLDVTNDDNVAKLVRTFFKTFTKIDGLVNVAGINLPLPLTHDTSLDAFTQTLDINLKGTFSFCRAYLQHVIKSDLSNDPPLGGYSIVNMGSMASTQGLPNMSAYCASKHAIVGLSKTMAKEYARKNVRVNVVAPGAIDTPLMEAILEKGPNSHDEVVEGIPLGRMGHVREVANVVAFLLSAESSYVTGAVLPVDGGVTL